MGLDAVYGEGSLAKLAKKVPRKGELEEHDTPDGSVRVYFTWPDGSKMKIAFRGEEVAFLHLSSQGKGLYAALVKAMLATFKELGIKAFVAAPRDTTARKVLMKQGDWKPGPNGSIRWTIG